MKPIFTAILMTCVLYGCGPLGQLKKTDAQIPFIGAIGKHSSVFFTKNFQKVGEPTLGEPIPITIQSLPLSSSMATKYNRYENQRGKEPLFNKKDTITVQTRYFQAQISDAISLTNQLNHPNNRKVKEYLQNDKDLLILTSISFITDIETEQRIRTAEHSFVDEIDGALTLVLQNGRIKTQINLSSLQVFDFETSGLCWKKDKRNQLQIAAILVTGNSCPGKTEKDSNKLAIKRSHLKL
ncbi:hypothetical protein HME9304_02733 [Flagellimonas maritima]|uniref:Lipoprotein n=1 Tax=Flagellimonas maritima TaxID=1383885 RepID=A0A2Z4LV57_9FLAO|nr:hypothetical protein [Allomuricauda aurantiaca]AWX45706.1 hypothetical protein HME9304_02733 [Allomuricauda aurantiaca]